MFDYIDGSGKGFDYCTIIRECAKVKYLSKYGADEFAPYVCLVDKLIAEGYGMGMVRLKRLQMATKYVISLLPITVL